MQLYAILAAEGLQNPLPDAAIHAIILDEHEVPVAAYPLAPQEHERWNGSQANGL